MSGPLERVEQKPRFSKPEGAKIPAPEVQLQHGPIKKPMPAAALWAKRAAQRAAKLDALYEASGVTPLCRTYDIVRPKG